MRVRIALVLLLLFGLTPVSIRGWGMDVHRYITRRAFEGLPVEMRGFYAAHLDFVSEHAADPDLWRMMDLRGELGTEDPNHFLDIDVLDEPAPFLSNGFVAICTDRANRAGRAVARRRGRLRWRLHITATRVAAATRVVCRPSSRTTSRMRTLFHAVGNYVAS